MLCYRPTLEPKGAHRLQIEASTIGYYVYVWLTPRSDAPEMDYLQDTREMAKEQSAEDFEVPLTAWASLDVSQPPEAS